MTTLGGTKIRLAQGRSGRALAEQRFHELKATQSRPSNATDARIADIIDDFLAWSQTHRAAETNRNHIWYGQKFSEHIGYLKATELRPIHLTRWIDEQSWGQTTQRNARRSIYRAFSWAVEEGLLRQNPLLGMKCPSARTRQRAMTDEEFRALMRGSKHDFKALLYSLRQTGCRPKEARMLTWGQVHDDRWMLLQHKTAHKTHTVRVIYLTKPMQRLMCVLRGKSDRNPAEPVFLNARQQPWTGNAIRLRIQRLKEKLRLSTDLCAYLARHAFGTSAILRGVDPVTVATLMGHRSLEMVSRVYVHLAGEHAHLQEAAERATAPLPAPTPPPGVSNRVG
jgi:integrase